LLKSENSPREHPETELDSEFWNNTPDEPLSLSVHEVLRQFDNRSLPYKGPRIFLYHKEKESWYDVTGTLDPALFDIAMVSEVDFDASGTLFIQLAETSPTEWIVWKKSK